ncbi:hypothetical protein BD410DRAFT_552509 [Rickenella mellea]|uniref:Uncharacterized protein n=1 Tax=Rickenella mellea TaxID=50990 RepID=A0A4Y7PS64_9AGAM|nr:hypothetical protein BD410DRAFT_552509 [Rickenella mellea]
MPGSTHCGMETRFHLETWPCHAMMIGYRNIQLFQVSRLILQFAPLTVLCASMVLSTSYTRVSFLHRSKSVRLISGSVQSSPSLTSIQYPLLRIHLVLILRIRTIYRMSIHVRGTNEYEDHISKIFIQLTTIYSGSRMCMDEHNTYAMISWVSRVHWLARTASVL